MRRACLLLLLLCLVALPGCVPESYLLVTPHNSQRGENSDVITVENYAAMRSNLVQQVDRHAEQVSMVTYSYAGDVEQDLQRALDYIQSSYPMGAYALEDATYEIVQVASFYQLQLQLTYSHSAWEMEQITQVRMENLENTIGEAITAGRGRQTLMISGFSNVDFAALCRSYLLEHPDQVLQLPQVSWTCWPETGSVRVVELHYAYPVAAAQLRQMRNQVEAQLQAAAALAGSGEQETAELLYQFLQAQYTGAQQDPQTPAYGVLCQGQGDAASFAAVYRLLCQQAGLNCMLVEGENDGTAYTWNILQLDGVYYHADLLSSLQAGLTQLPLRGDAAMTGYSWDSERYPVCPQDVP